jgi:pyrroloquinoline quinone (PQQ) biosynthesis protein C
MSSSELTAAAKRWDLLTHAFYRRWIAGELALDELQDYACQYHRVVKAIPGCLRQAAVADSDNRAKLSDHADEEESHVEMWADFAISLGVSAAQLTGTRPNPATAALLEAGDKLTALEAQTPAVSVAKLDGLREQYGIDAQSGGRYFELHHTMDIDHADELKRVIESDAALSAAAPATTGDDARRALEPAQLGGGTARPGLSLGRHRASHGATMRRVCGHGPDRVDLGG